MLPPLLDFLLVILEILSPFILIAIIVCISIHSKRVKKREREEEIRQEEARALQKKMRALEEIMSSFPELETYDIDVPLPEHLDDTSHDALNSKFDYNIGPHGEVHGANSLRLDFSARPLPITLLSFFATTPGIRGWRLNRKDGDLAPFLGDAAEARQLDNTNADYVTRSIVDECDTLSVPYVNQQQFHIAAIKQIIQSLNAEALNVELGPLGWCFSYTGWVSVGQIDAVFCHVTRNKPDRLVAVKPRLDNKQLTADGLPFFSFGYTIPAKNGVEALNVWQASPSADEDTRNAQFML